MPRITKEEMRIKREALAQAAGLHEEDAEWLLGAFHWSLDDFLPAAHDGSLRSLLQQSTTHCDVLLCTLAAEIFGSSLNPSQSVRLGCNQVEEGAGCDGPAAWRDDLPPSCNWRIIEEEEGLKARLPLLRLVDPPIQIGLMPSGGHWAYSAAGVIIAQMRWQLWKAGRTTDRQAEAAIIEECHNYGSRLAFQAKPQRDGRGDATKEPLESTEIGNFAGFSRAMAGQVMGQSRYGVGGGVRIVQTGLVQSAWFERYGFDAPLPSSAAFTQFLKQWLFNYGPLYATIDGLQLHTYSSGVITQPTSDGSEEPIKRNCAVLVVGYCDATVDANSSTPNYATGHWLCRTDLGAGPGFGEGGFFRVAYGALGINDAMQFMVVRLN